MLLFENPCQIWPSALESDLREMDGFEIARQDLLIRGPGEFLGARQSECAMLRFANLEDDIELLEAARELAPEVLQHAGRKRQRRIWNAGCLDASNTSKPEALPVFCFPACNQPKKAPHSDWNEASRDCCKQQRRNHDEAKLILANN
jgi:hypothetical protein